MQLPILRRRFGAFSTVQASSLSNGSTLIFFLLWYATGRHEGCPLQERVTYGRSCMAYQGYAILLSHQQGNLRRHVPSPLAPLARRATWPPQSALPCYCLPFPPGGGRVCICGSAYCLSTRPGSSSVTGREMSRVSVRPDCHSPDWSHPARAGSFQHVPANAGTCISPLRERTVAAATPGETAALKMPRAFPGSHSLAVSIPKLLPARTTASAEAYQASPLRPPVTPSGSTPHTGAQELAAPEATPPAYGTPQGTLLHPAVPQHPFLRPPASARASSLDHIARSSGNKQTSAPHCTEAPVQPTGAPATMDQAFLRTAGHATAPLSAAQRDTFSYSASLLVGAQSPSLTARLPLPRSNAWRTKGSQPGFHSVSHTSSASPLTRCSLGFSLTPPSDFPPSDPSPLPLPLSAPTDSLGYTGNSEPQPPVAAGTPQAQEQGRNWPRALGAALLVAAVALGAAALLFPQATGAMGAVGARVRSSATDTIATSPMGPRVVCWLRERLGRLSDEAIVVLLAALPVVELRGAVPVALWMGMSSAKAFWLSVLGNMIPVPFLLLLMGSAQQFLAARVRPLGEAMDALVACARAKSAPLQEFHFVGVMLFVGVPLPGTGAWCAALASHLLNVPFWNALWASFFGVLIAGAIMCNLCLGGCNRALVFAANLFLLSGGTWSVIKSVASVMKATGR